MGILGVIELFLGFIALASPWIVGASFIWVIGIMLMILAVVRLVQVFTVPSSRWWNLVTGAIWLQTRSLPASGWRLFNVIITLILGLMVIFGWPESTAWFIGTLIAVELIFSGWTLLLYAFSGNSARR